MFALRYMLDYFLLFHIFQTTSVNARWGQPWLIQPQKLSKTSLRLDAFVCYVLVMKRMKLVKNVVFWFFLVVVYGSMYSHEDMNVNKFGMPTTKHFIKGGKCELSKGKKCLLMVNAGKWGVKIKKWRRCQLLFPNFRQSCLPTFQCFQSFVSWTPFWIFSFCDVSHAVVSGTYPSVAVP